MVPGRERPRVVVHVAVSLDGATAGFDVDVATFYRLAGSWAEDLTLTGADTILAQEEALQAEPGPGPASDGPLLAVVDSRARVAAWSLLRQAGYWSDVIALRARDSPPRADEGVQAITAGQGRVDLAMALAELRRTRGVETVRVDSGGQLIGALLDDGLVDELSLLLHPVIAGGAGERRWTGGAARPSGFHTTSAETLAGGLVWLRLAAVA